VRLFVFSSFSRVVWLFRILCHFTLILVSFLFLSKYHWHFGNDWVESKFNVDILTILNLSIYEHRYFSFLSLIFSSMFCSFSLCRSFFLLSYLILFDASINVFFLNFLFRLVIEANRNTSSVFLVLHLASLLNSFISSNRFL
jgi:hypothetical protein